MATTPAFVSVGALASNATTASMAITAPTFTQKKGDILIAYIGQKANQVITAPAGWKKFVEVNNTTAQRATIAWKRAVAADSGAAFTFTKPVDDNLLFYGCIALYENCIDFGDPMDPPAATTSGNASSDTVTYATFDPINPDALVIAAGFYNEDNTTAGSISGTNPTFSLRVDLETLTGTDGSIFVYDGVTDGAVTGARSHSTTSAIDAINIGVLFALRPSTHISSRRTGASESISTYGAGQTYTPGTLATWESDTDNDNVTALVSPVLACLAAEYDDSVVLDGSVNNGSYFRIIRPQAGNFHAGKRDTGVRFYATADASVFVVNGFNNHLQDIVVRTTQNSATARHGIQLAGVSTDSAVVGCIATACSNAGAGANNGFQHSAAATNRVFWINCISEGNENLNLTVANTAGIDAIVYNMTSANSVVSGLSFGANATTTATNVLSALSQTGNDFNGTLDTGSNNASEDATGMGTSPRINQTFTFVDAGNHDYHLAGNDAGARNFGIDLSADSLYPFNDDIDRQTIAQWDIGADEPGELIDVPSGAIALSGIAASLAFVISMSVGALAFAGATPSLVVGAGATQVPAGALVFSGHAPNLAEGIGIPVGALTFTGASPPLADGVGIPTGALTFTGLSPAGLTGTNITPAAGTLTLTGLAPSLADGIGLPAGALIFTGTSSALAFGIDIGAGSLVLTGQGPALLGAGAIEPGAGVLLFTGHAPNLAHTLPIGAGALTLAGLSPGISQGTIVFLPAGALTFTGLAPLPGTGVLIPAGALSLTGHAFNLQTGVLIPAGTLTLTGQTPSLASTLPIGAGALTFTGLAPVSGKGVIIPAGALTLTGLTPSLHTGLNIPAGALVFSGLSPSLQAGIPIGAGNLTLTGLAPQLDRGIPIGAGALAFTGLTPNLATVILLPAGALEFTGLAPSAFVGTSLFTPDAGVLTLTGHAPVLAYAIQIPSGELVIVGYAPNAIVPFPAVADVIILVGPEY